MKLFRRIFALVLCCCLCFCMTGCITAGNISYEPLRGDPLAPSAPEGLSPADREVVDCSTLEFVPFDAEAYLAQLEEARALWEQPGQEEAVIENYWLLTKGLTECIGAYKNSEVLFYADYTNEAMKRANQDAYTGYMDCADAYSIYLRDILSSDYREAHIAEVGEDNALMYADYLAMTDEQKALNEKEKELQDRYTTLAGEEYESYEATAEVMAPLYLELIDVRNQLAESYGYDDYPTYAYENLYVRGYTPEDARRMEELVKGNLSGLYIDSLLSMTEEDYNAYYKYPDISQDGLLGLMQEYLPAMDSQLGESLDYMLASRAYDIEYRDTKYAASFTTMLNSYGVPYLFSQPTEGSQVYSLDTLVHEFGHYHSYLNDPTYYTEDGYIYSLDDLDVAEVNSTGLELLFLEYYPELYGEDAEALQRGILSNILSNVIYGCIMDEFQQRVYTTPELTADGISEIFYEVFNDYMNHIYIDDYSYYLWAVVNHNFDAPMYYISYGISALAAFQLWEEAQTDFDSALARYMELTAYGTDVDFKALLKVCGMKDVFEESYLDSLYSTLSGVL